MIKAGWSAAMLLAIPMIGILAADPPPENTGKKVGEKAPAFSLTDQSGKEHTLKQITKDRPVALVFYRSAQW